MAQQISGFFILLLIIVGCKESKHSRYSDDIKLQSTNCIKLVLEKDSIFGVIRNHSSERISLSETINNYSKNLKSLDYSNCPEEFELAFHKHIDAWLDFRKISDKYPLLHGELHDIFAIIEKSKDSSEFKSRLNQILETWKIIEQSAN